ncbi:MAG: ABC transporter permease [Nocardioidaceae bacterium]
MSLQADAGVSVHGQIRPRHTEVRLVTGTARVFLLRFASNPIMLIRGPLGPVLTLVGFHLVYDISGQHQVAGVDAMGFLVVGMLGSLAWSSTVWGSGNAIQSEVYQGTVSSVLVAPGRISSVIVGYGVGSILFNVPALIVSVLAGVLFGADFRLDHPVAVLVTLAAVYGCCLCIGLGFGGLFVLSRQSNALSNFLQGPVYLLAGLFVPRSVFPEWLQWVSDVLPIAHAVDALRATTLSGASLAEVWPALAASAATSLLFLAAGLWGLHHLDDVVRRRATLDLL